MSLLKQSVEQDYRWAKKRVWLQRIRVISERVANIAANVNSAHE
jgi:hypothetical protein